MTKFLTGGGGDGDEDDGQKVDEDFDDTAASEQGNDTPEPSEPAEPSEPSVPDQ